MEKGWTNDESKLTEQPHKLGLEKATPLCYAAFPSRLCGTLCAMHHRGNMQRWVSF
jgi:hypothetical protein